ncbi:MAG: bacteriocin [Ruminococcus sp.]|jgi:bacteriocin-like protein|nr:bacteriocin [Ruminococcus sp.]
MDKEQFLAEVKNAKTPEDIITIFKTGGKEISLDEAAKYLEQFKKTEGKTELSESELENIIGGARYDGGPFDGYLSIPAPLFTICNSYSDDGSWLWRCCFTCRNYTMFSCSQQNVQNFRGI